MKKNGGLVDTGGSFTCACNAGFTDRGISNGKQCWTL